MSGSDKRNDKPYTVKGVHFGPEDDVLLAWVEKQENFSRYVKGLVSADMRAVTGDVDPRLRAEVERAILLIARQLMEKRSEGGAQDDTVDPSLTGGLW